MNHRIIDASFHRNGISGQGFYAVLFYDSSRNNEIMIATLFDEPGYCAIYQVDELSKLNIKFANGNSWRGDHYESDLRQLLADHQKEHGTNRNGDFSFPMKL